MNESLTSLCIIPKDTWVEADWSSLGCENIRPRKVQACLLNLFTYNDSHEVIPIQDWAAAKKGYAINIDIAATYEQLRSLLYKFAPQESGIYVYSGDPTRADKSWTRNIEHLGSKIKTCRIDNHPEYAASHAISLDGLIGFDPDVGPGCHFTLGWFPSDDPINEVILRKWDEWPDSKCEAMLPISPSPSDRSIELVEVGWDMQGICIFIGESRNQELSPEDLRRILGEDAVLAGVEHSGNDFWKWFEDRFDIDDLIPIDRDLPFSL
ncbi:MAG: hypothetical protein ABFD64_05235 [Armatimonadota bacterium]